MKIAALISISGASLLAVAFVACSSDDATTTTPTPDSGIAETSTTADTGSSSGIDEENCIPNGTPPNEQGIGGYCSPVGNQCDTAGPGMSGRICTADITNTPAHAWFCTYPCEDDSTCGTDAHCVHHAEGSGCVPKRCDYLAGPDSGIIEAGTGDAASDAPHDAANDG